MKNTSDPPDILINLDKNLVIREALNARLRQRHIQIAGILSAKARFALPEMSFILCHNRPLFGRTIMKNTEVNQQNNALRCQLFLQIARARRIFKFQLTIRATYLAISRHQRGFMKTREDQLPAVFPGNN